MKLSINKIIKYINLINPFDININDILNYILNMY